MPRSPKNPPEPILTDELLALAAKMRIQPTPDGSPKRAYHHTTTGVSVDTGVCLFIGRTFHLNELYGKIQPFLKKEKMSDAEIERLIVEEFPDSKMAQRLKQSGPGRMTVNQLRQQYNSGNLTLRQTNQLFSFRYNAEGKVVDGRFGRRVLTEEEQEIDKQRVINSRKRVIARKKKKGEILEWWYGDIHRVELVPTRKPYTKRKKSDA